MLRLTAKDGRSLSVGSYALILLLCLCFFVPGIASLPPTDRDESLFAQATKQMIETGDFVDIKVQDKPRYQKPIGIYWLQAASVKLLTPEHLNEIWAYRVPAVLGATIAVLMTAALGSLLFTPMTGFVAALMLMGCTILNVESHLAKTDAALLASIVTTQYALARAWRDGTGGGGIRSLGNFLLFWTALAVGILIKGPIILLVLLGTLLWLWRTEKDLGWFKNLRPIFGIVYLLLLVSPWFIAIMMASHGAFAQQSAGNDLLGKIWNGQNRGKLPPGLHLIVFPVMFFPFSLFAFLAAPDVWRNRRDSTMRFFLGWIVPTWIVFELSLTKLPHYTMPAFPAIAILAADALLRGFPTITQSLRRWPQITIVFIWSLIGSGFAILFATLSLVLGSTGGVAGSFNGSIPQIIASIVLILSQGACLLFMIQKRLKSSALALNIGSLIFMVTVFSHTLPNLPEFWLSREAALSTTILAPCETTQLITSGYSEPSLVFLNGTDTHIAADTAEAAQRLKNDSCALVLIDRRHKGEFLGSFGKGDDQPTAVGTIHGYNLGNGKWFDLDFYLSPREAMGLTPDATLPAGDMPMQLPGSAMPVDGKPDTDTAPSAKAAKAKPVSKSTENPAGTTDPASATAPSDMDDDEPDEDAPNSASVPPATNNPP